jgi:hypothetical protein
MGAQIAKNLAPYIPDYGLAGECGVAETLRKPAGSTRVTRPLIGDPPQPSIRTGAAVADQPGEPRSDGGDMRL